MRGLTVVATAVALLMLGVAKQSDSVAQAPPDWTPVAGLPLEDPAQVRPDASGTVSVKLTAEPQTIDVSGAPLGARPWDTDVPGPTSLNAPTIHVRPGGTIKVTFVNRLGAQIPTNIHYHGMHVSPRGLSDNIFRTFDNGKTYESVVHLPDDHDRGTYWYHVHLHGMSEGQVMGGLSGLLVVDGLAGLLPRAWEDVPQRQFALRDVQTSGNAIVAEDDIAIPAPSTRLVNALYQPTFTMRENRYELWRLANIGADVFYKLVFRNRAQPEREARFAVIAEDGLPVWDVDQRDTLLLPPGKRFDVLVAAPDAGTYDLVSLQYAQRYVQNPPAPAPPTSLDPKPLPVEVVDGTRVPVDQTLATATVAASSRTVPDAPLPERLVPREDLSDERVARKRTFRFQYTPPSDPNFATLINGKQFEPTDKPMAAPVRGAVEEWTLINQTTDDHPFHIHVNNFQVISVNGKRYSGNSHQDVVDIPAQTLVDGELVDGKVVIRQKYERFTGWFVFHCHILQHEDAGMMATIQVRKSRRVPVQPPPEFRNGGDMGHMAGSKPRMIRPQLAASSHRRRLFCPLRDRPRGWAARR